MASVSNWWISVKWSKVPRYLFAWEVHGKCEGEEEGTGGGGGDGGVIPTAGEVREKDS